MIYFRHRPDAVFTAIVHEALERERTKIAALGSRHDLSAWEACYPHTSRHFTLPSAVPTLERLLGASRETAVYRLPESQWLLLYECLENFCVELNDVALDQPGGTLPVGEYRLSEIDFDALVALYFWDTDFLAHLDEPAPAGSLETVEHPAWEKGDSSWFRPRSTRYPDWDEGADF